jgi:hypothetical protein
MDEPDFHPVLVELLRAAQAGELSARDKDAIGWAISRSTRFNLNAEMHRSGVQADDFLKKLNEFVSTH